MEDITKCPNCGRVTPASEIHDGKCYYCLKDRNCHGSVSMMAMCGATVYGVLMGLVVGYLIWG